VFSLRLRHTHFYVSYVCFAQAILIITVNGHVCVRKKVSSDLDESLLTICVVKVSAVYSTVYLKVFTTSIYI